MPLSRFYDKLRQNNNNNSNIRNENPTIEY